MLISSHGCPATVGMPRSEVASGGHLVLRAAPGRSHRDRRTVRIGTMLLGREQERLAIDRLLAEARDGQSGVLALVGEPGIGKTALLEYAAEQAGRDGGASRARDRVRGRGAVRRAAELLRPALGMLDRIPAPQATALGGALALGPPSRARSLRDRRRDSEPALRLRRRGAAAAARRRRPPARRLERRGAPLRRPPARRRSDRARAHRARGRAVAAGRRRPPDAPARPGSIRSDAAELLCASGVGRGRAERLYRATGGNPLALLELGSDRPDCTLRARRRAGADLGQRSRPPSRGASTCSARRHGACWCSWPRAMRASSAPSGAPPRRSVSASTTSSPRRRPASFASTVSRLEFVHPLARSAAVCPRVRPPSAAQRTRRSRRRCPIATSDRRAWHLAAASAAPNPRPPPRSSRPEREPGHGARTPSPPRRTSGLDGSRRGTSPAARSCSPRRRPPGSVATYGRTLALLDEARPHTSDLDAGRASTTCAAQVAMRRGPVMDGYPLIVAAAEQLAPSDPRARRLMLAEAVHALLLRRRPRR